MIITKPYFDTEYFDTPKGGYTEQSPSEGYFKVTVSEDGYITLPVDVKRMPAIIKVESPSEEGKESLREVFEKSKLFRSKNLNVDEQNLILRIKRRVYMDSDEEIMSWIRGFKLQELEKSEKQETLAKVWEEGVEAANTSIKANGYNTQLMIPTFTPKNPYAKPEAKESN